MTGYFFVTTNSFYLIKQFADNILALKNINKFQVFFFF